MKEKNTVQKISALSPSQEDTSLHIRQELPTRRKLRIRVENLSYRYENAPRNALEGVSFEIREGEYISVLGANGSGKSTLLNCLNGLCPPPAGCIHINSPEGLPLDPADDASLGRIRQMLGTVLQNPDDQIISSVVEEDVAFGPENLGLSRNEVWVRVCSAIKAVGLDKFRHKASQFLSGGERQRLAIAGILAMGGDIIALDEAVTMIDPAGREQVLSFLEGLAAEGKTVIQVTHSLEDVFRSGRCLVLHRGKLVFDGKPEALLEESGLDEWGFRLPESIRAIRYMMDRYPGFSVSSLDPSAAATAMIPFLQIPPPAREARSSSEAEEKLSESRDRADNNAATADTDTATGMGSPDSAVVFEDVTHDFLVGTAFAAAGIQGVSCGIPRGRSVAFIGITGSGKTTVLKHMNALLLPSKGTVRVLGINTLDKRENLRSLRFRVSLAIQNAESALFEAYVGDDVAYGPRNAGLKGKVLVEQVKKAMEQAGLSFDEFKDRQVRSLSGGEKRRTAIAGVLALDSEMVLLDEPAAALDGKGQERILSLVEGLRQEGKTVIATTHSMEYAGRFDLIGVMRDGKLAALAPPEEIFGGSWDEGWGMHKPWTAEFADKLKEGGFVPAFDGVPLNAEELIGFLSGSEVKRTPENGNTEGDRAPQGSSAPRKSHPSAESRNEKYSTLPKKYRRKKTGLEFFRNVNLGQFLDRPSPLRRLGAGKKMLLVLCCGITAIAGPTLYFPLGILGMVLLAGFFLGKIGPKHLLRNLIPALPYMGILLIFQVLFSWPDDQSRVWFSLGFFSVTADELYRALMIFCRLLVFIALLSLYSGVTPLRETLKAVNGFLIPLSRIGLPGRDISLAVGVTFRFIPILTEEAERIAAAQISRGGGYAEKGRIRAAAAMVIPLFLRALERSEILARAMVLRLFGTTNEKDT